MESRAESIYQLLPYDPLAPMNAEKIAALLGLKYTRPLDILNIYRLRKPLPGYTNLLDACARKMEAEGEGFRVGDVTPEALREIEKEQAFLASREAALRDLLVSVRHQRMLVDNKAMGMLQKLARWIVLLAEEDVLLLSRWKFLRDYLARFRSTGPRPKKVQGSGENGLKTGVESGNASETSGGEKSSASDQRASKGKKKSGK